MARLVAGQRAPEFSLLADDGSTVSLSGLLAVQQPSEKVPNSRGNALVLYFYPKSNNRLS